MTQEELAGMAGIPLSTIRKVEQGQSPTPGFWPIARMAHVLAVEITELLGDDLPERAAKPRGEAVFSKPRVLGPPARMYVIYQGRRRRFPPGTRVWIEGKVIGTGDEPIREFTIEPDIFATEGRQREP